MTDKSDDFRVVIRAWPRFAIMARSVEAARRAPGIDESVSHKLVFRWHETNRISPAWYPDIEQAARLDGIKGVNPALLYRLNERWGTEKRINKAGLR